MIDVLNKKITYKLNNSEVGYILFSNVDDNTIIIDKVFVNESNRGKGIASKMLEFTYDYFTKKNIKIIYECYYSKKWRKKNKKLF